MTVKKYLEMFREMRVKPRVICKDGYSVSIQNSKYHHCKLDSVELGFPSELEDELSVYAEDENTTETVFDYVPLETIEKVVAKHGGIKNVKLYD